MAQLRDIFKGAFTDEFLLEQGLDNTPGFTGDFVFFRNSNMATSPEFQELWEYGNVQPVYTYTAPAGADYYIYSDNNTDNAFFIMVLLDTNYVPYNIIGFLSGHTPVKLVNPANPSTKWLRVNRVFNVSPFVNNGTVYITEGNNATNGVPNVTTDVRSVIKPLTGQSLNCQYTVPAGKYAVIYQYGVSLAKKQDVAADVELRVRPFGGTFILAELMALQSTGNVEVLRKPIPLFALAPKYDFTMKATVSADCGIIGFANMMLVDEKYEGRI